MHFEIESYKECFEKPEISHCHLDFVSRRRLTEIGKKVTGSEEFYKSEKRIEIFFSFFFSFLFFNIVSFSLHLLIFTLKNIFNFRRENRGFGEVSAPKLGIEANHFDSAFHFPVFFFSIFRLERNELNIKNV